MKYTESLMVRLTPELKEAIEQAAAKQALAPSTLARSMLFRVFMPDQATVEQCRTLVDTRAEYHADRPGSFITAQIPEGE